MTGWLSFAAIIFVIAIAVICVLFLQQTHDTNRRMKR